MTPKAASRPKGAYHHGDLENALVAAALGQIAESGARSLSLREVARATGVSHAAAYRHFPSKESLLAAVAERGFIALTAALQAAALAHPGDTLGRFAALGVAYVDFAVTHPHHLQVMFGDAIARHEDYPSLAAAGLEAYGLLGSSLDEARGGGFISAGDARVLQLAAWSQVHGLALLIASGQVRADGPEPLDHKGLTLAVLAVMRDGLGARQASSSST